MLHKTALGTSKSHFSLDLASTDLVDVSIANSVQSGSPSISLGAKAGDTAFVVSYSDPGEDSGGGRVELFAKDREDAENWQARIMGDWERARGEEVGGGAVKTVKDD